MPGGSFEISRLSEYEGPFVAAHEFFPDFDPAVVEAVREQACDDMCVHVLGGSKSYRASLVEVASGVVRRPEPALGLAMAGPTRLGRRLQWIDRTRGTSRCVLQWPARFGLLTAARACSAISRHCCAKFRYLRFNAGVAARAPSHSHWRAFVRYISARDVTATATGNLVHCSRGLNRENFIPCPPAASRRRGLLDQQSSLP